MTWAWLEKRRLGAVVPAIPILVLIGVWQLLSSWHLKVSIPSPGLVAATLVQSLVAPVGQYPLWGHVLWSLERVLAAFVLAAALGLPLGLLMGWNKTFEAVAKPIFEVFRPIPPIAWIPLAILWLGIGEAPKIFICFIGAFVSVTVNTYAGVRLVDPVLVGAARTLGANDRQVFTEVVIPGSLPAIFAGLQTGISSSWMCVLAAEMVRSSEGVGWLILAGMETVNTAQIMAGMLTIGAVGAALAGVLRWAERKVCPWRRS